MHSSSLELTVEANLREAEGRILERVCPIYGINARRQHQLIGSSVLLSVASRSFLLTAAHVLEKPIGLAIEYRSNPSVLAAVRISAVVAPLTDTHPELAGYLPAPTRASFVSSIPGVGRS
jgi:hypothetical protein